MNSEEAKFILQAYRPNTEDDRDPHFVEALEQLKKDPALAKWFVEQQAFDQAMFEKVSEQPVPSDLRANILAGRSLVRPRPFFQRPSILAMAAAVALMFVAIGAFQMSGPKANTWEKDMAAFLERDFTLTRQTASVEEIQAWLAENSNVQQTFPSKLKNTPAFGCRTIEWNGRTVTLACFNFEDSVVHIFAMNRSDFPQLDEGSAPTFHPVDEWATACWGDEQTHYFAASLGGEDLLKTLLL